MTDQEQSTILLATKIMGWSVVPWADWTRWEHGSRQRTKDFANVAVLMEGKVYPVQANGHAPLAWSPFTSIADAWMLVDKLTYDTPEGFQSLDLYSFIDVTGIHWHCSIHRVRSCADVFAADAPTACEAICAAALRSISEGKSE